LGTRIAAADHHLAMRPVPRDAPPSASIQSHERFWSVPTPGRKLFPLLAVCPGPASPHAHVFRLSILLQGGPLRGPLPAVSMPPRRRGVRPGGRSPRAAGWKGSGPGTTEGTADEGAILRRMTNFRVESHSVRMGGNELPRSMGGGSWDSAFCRKCGQKAIALHNKPECHVCSDWNGCGGDCTWSGWRCEKCDITEGY
jgi:hypothetical protein